MTRVSLESTDLELLEQVLSAAAVDAATVGGGGTVGALGRRGAGRASVDALLAGRRTVTGGHVRSVMPLADLERAVDAFHRADHELSRSIAGDAGSAVGSLELVVLALAVDGLAPGVHRWTPGGPELLHEAWDREEDEWLDDVVVLRNTGTASAALFAVGDVAEATAWGGAHGYRWLLVRAGFAVEQCHLAAVERGLVGAIFAGLNHTVVRGWLPAGEPSSHPLLGLALGLPEEQHGA